nr:hypothetical protein BACY1_00080 [Tenacibaculum mesophilum]
MFLLKIEDCQKNWRNLIAIPKFCVNEGQPSIKTFMILVQTLGADVKVSMTSTKKIIIVL